MDKDVLVPSAQRHEPVLRFITKEQYEAGWREPEEFRPGTKIGFTGKMITVGPLVKIDPETPKAEISQSGQKGQNANGNTAL